MAPAQALTGSPSDTEPGYFNKKRRPELTSSAMGETVRKQPPKPSEEPSPYPDTPSLKSLQAKIAVAEATWSRSSLYRIPEQAFNAHTESQARARLPARAKALW